MYEGRGRGRNYRGSGGGGRRGYPNFRPRGRYNSNFQGYFPAGDAYYRPPMRYMSPAHQDQRVFVSSRYGNNFQQSQPLQTYYYTSGLTSPQTANTQHDNGSAVCNGSEVKGQVEEGGAVTSARKEGERGVPGVGSSVAEDNMAEKLTRQLSEESYECMVCCDSIRVSNAVWSCSNCHHVFHLPCIQEWSRTVLANPSGAPDPFHLAEEVEMIAPSRPNSAYPHPGRGRRNLMIADVVLAQYGRNRTSTSISQRAAGTDSSQVTPSPIEGMSCSVHGWRCPACQYRVTSGVPSVYNCFCGKENDPQFTPGYVPHTCGEMCGRKGPSRGCDCDHPCTLLCHPGPCPPCVAMTTKTCDCGKVSKSVRCDKSVVKCEQVCGRDLPCKKHRCEQTCHRGSCGDCTETVQVKCFCGKDTCAQVCKEFNEQHSCKKICGKCLNCGNHKCTSVCHPGDCQKCQTSLDIVSTCPCGKQSVDQLGGRQSCLDPIPTCGEICGKKLNCGSPHKRHVCGEKCHLGCCPVCPLDTHSRCRCGANSITLKCAELPASGEVLCGRVCKKKLDCNKHQCRQLCCVLDPRGHVCSATCNRLLSCGLHHCVENCHRGNCDRCWDYSFEDLTCHCGRSKIPAPVPCGTAPPECDFPCMRHHPCGHSPQHNCHSEEKCPPCAVLIAAPCLGGHQMMNCVPCYMQKLSCGRPCGKGLPNCDHLCVLTCHSGQCLGDGQSCEQKCQRRRYGCGHACNQLCHYSEGDCPPTPCKQLVSVTCGCGRFKQQMPCHDYTERSQLQRSVEHQLSGLSVDVSSSGSSSKMLQLACRDSCRRDAWFSRLESAFGAIENNPTVQFTEYLLQMGSSGGYSEFIYELEKTFFSLVQSCVDTGMKQQHSFKPMNTTRRRMVHELAEFYGLDSQAYDEEPMKHVVVFGYRNRVKIPPVSLTSLISTKLKELSSNVQPNPGIISFANAPNPLARQVQPRPPQELQTSTPRQMQGDLNKWSSVANFPNIQNPNSSGVQFLNATNAPSLGSATNWASNFSSPWGQTSSQGQSGLPGQQFQGSLGSGNQPPFVNQWVQHSTTGHSNSQMQFTPTQQAWSVEAGGGDLLINARQFEDERFSEEMQAGLVSLGQVRSQPRPVRGPPSALN